MKIRSGLSAIALVCAAASAFAQGSGDLVLVNGRVYRVTEREPIAEAVLVEDGRISIVGRSEDVLAGAAAGTRVIDLQNKTVVPGFIDSHGHLMNLGLGLQRLDFVGTRSYQEIVDAVGRKADSVPEDEWITGRGWDQNDWPEKAFPHHEALSRRSPFNPVALTRVDGHATLANAKALEIAGIDRDTADPPGGRIVRDADGDPTGVLVDRAAGLVGRHIPPESDQNRRAAMLDAIQECLRYGLTSVHDAGISGTDIALFKSMVDDGAFGLRVYAMIRAGDAGALEEHFAAGPLIGYGEDRLTVRSVKAMVDGALGSRGAALLKPYADDPENTGLLITQQADLEALTKRALEAGFQVASHAIGDRGNRVVLDAYERALRAVPREKYDYSARLRVEHAQVVALKDIPRFAALGVIPSMQATHATSDMYWAEERVGAERAKGAYAWRRFLKAGSRIANGSDFPVEGVNPLWGFYASVTRQDHAGVPEGGWQPSQRMTREEALKSFTLDAAYAAFEEDLKGSVEVGKLGDLVVLSADIMTIPAHEILEAQVLMTVLGGEIVYER